MIGVGSTLNERFTLEKELGQGGMGTVYRATDRVLGRSVAVKLLIDSGTEDNSKQIRLEAQILARLVHERIVRLYDFGESEGHCYLIMEEVTGPSFANRWRDLRLEDRLRVCGQVVEALDYAHVQGVIHRDVKPGNVLMTPADDAKLSDFGLSLVRDARSGHSGTIRGTPRYMSPEQAQGKPLDHRSDLYSVGVMLYEIATGDAPFGGSAMSVLGQHVNAVPTSPQNKNPEISSTLERLILRLLEKNPGRRPASAKVVALALVEEAERVRRLDRINLGINRSIAAALPGSPESTTVNLNDPQGRATPTNGSAPGVELPNGAAARPLTKSERSDVTRSAPSLFLESLRWPRKSRTSPLDSHTHPAAREMLAALLGTPIVLSPEERYLCGHYLAYLLGGSRRRGVFLRRPNDVKNSNRARLILAMTWLSSIEPTDDAIALAASLLEDRPDVRAALSPIVVMKYLASRETVGKRKRFRQVRKRLQEASTYGRSAMLDANGVLNPGMMPRTLDDLASIVPPQTIVDAHRVSLWNRVAEVWRDDDDFRQAVLSYATRSDRLDKESADLWPEVVYPLIERAHWQRKFRPRHEAIWDYIIGRILHVPLPGVRLDRMMIVAIPIEVATQFDEDLFGFIDDPRIDEDDLSPTESQTTQEPRPFYFGSTIPREERPVADDDAPRVKPTVPLSPTTPFVFGQNTLKNLWEAAMDARHNGGTAGLSNRKLPVGRYEIAVIPTGRGQRAVRAVLQGLSQGKQIEIFTPSAADREARSRSVLAAWTYEDASVAIIHLDFQYRERFILWHAPDLHQFNFDYLAELKQRLATVSLQVPEDLETVLKKS